jgi:hypothetical protein
MVKVVDQDKPIYYNLIDCCSNEIYIYPAGHPYAGSPAIIKWTGLFFDIQPSDIISIPLILSSFEDSSGNITNGCFLLVGALYKQDPPNTQNWYDAIHTNLVTSEMCCDCNTSCTSLFFQWTGVYNLGGSPIHSFVGPTGQHDGHNYYEIVGNWNNLTIYIWFSIANQQWVTTEILGDETEVIDYLVTTDSVPAAADGTMTTWSSQRFQSYMCKLPDPIIPPVLPAGYPTTHPEEKYQLTCCSTGEALKVNGLPAIFIFKGITRNDNHPDDYQEVVLTSIKDISGNLITGCYRIMEAECFDEWEELLWENIFIETECVSTCQECLPKPVIIPPVTNHKMIYPDFIVNNAEPFDAEQIFCAFGDANYEKVLALRYGIQFCCPTDLMQSTIEHEILKMDIAEDPNACCPIAPLPGTCKKYSITIPINVEGWLYFKDCNRIVRTVMFYSASVPYEVFVCGITEQTSADIYILANNQDLLQVQFSEGVDCN